MWRGFDGVVLADGRLLLTNLRAAVIRRSDKARIVGLDVRKFKQGLATRVRAL